MTARSRRSLLRGGLTALAAVGCDRARDPYALVKPPLSGAVARYDGEEHTVATCCAQCPLGCGIKVRVVEGRAVKVEGNPDHPVGGGGVGPRGQCAADVLYSPARVPGPLKRTGERGAGRFTPVSWDEALSAVAGELLALRSGGTPERMVALCGRERGAMAELWSRFCRAYGTPNFFQTGRRGRSSAVARAARLCLGSDDLPAWDLANAGMVVSLGAGLFEGSCLVHALKGRAAGRPVSRRTRYVQVEHAYSLSATASDDFVAVKPGTLDVFAYAVARVLIKEGLIDKEFVAQHTHGLADWSEPDGTRHSGLEQVLEQYTPDRAAALCGVSAESILRLAREAAARRPTVFVVDDRSTSSSNGLSVARAALALNALLGSIDRPGGVLVQRQPPLASWPAPQLDALAAADRPKLDRASLLKHPLADQVADAIADPALAPGVLFLDYTNPLYGSAEPARIRAAMEKIPFVVSFSPFHDETTAWADYVLPDHTFLERFEDATPAPALGFAALGIRQPVVRPVHDTRSTGDVLLRLASLVGGSVAASLPWKDFKEAFAQRAQGLEKLLDSGHWSAGPYKYEQWQETLRTPSGKFEFFSQEALARVRGTTPKLLPRQAPTPEATDLLCLGAPTDARWVGDPGHYPLYFLPYYPLMHAVDGPLLPHLREIGDVLTGSRWTAAAELNPRTAAAAGIADGDFIVVESQAGRLRVRAKLYEGVPPDAVRMPVGYGHSAGSAAAGGQGASPREILVADAVNQLGEPSLWSTRVRVEKART